MGQPRQTIAIQAHSKNDAPKKLLAFVTASKLLVVMNGPHEAYTSRKPWLCSASCILTAFDSDLL
jgi:hypothetical protein